MTYIRTGDLFFSILHKPFSITLNHQLLTTIHQNHQLSGGLYHLLFTLVSAPNITKELLEVRNHIRRGNNQCLFAEAANPAIELVADFHIGSHNEVSVIVRTIENLCPSSESLNHSVQKRIDEPHTDPFLLTAVHGENPLGVCSHVNLGELCFSFSWLVRHNIHALHAV